MNERILELAKQCGYWSGQTIEMNDVGIEKFAQLIVQECSRFVGDHTSVAVKKMKEHFGVEE